MGAGKLGLPIALAIEQAGYSVQICDPDERVAKYLSGEMQYPHLEASVRELLKITTIKSVGVKDLVAHSDLIFVCVQTPHGEGLDGTKPYYGVKPQDFDYSHLQKAVADLSYEIQEQGKPCCMAIISTVLPGTTRGLLLPMIPPCAALVYAPQFAAMGTVIHDFIHPEFFVFGGDGMDHPMVRVVEEFVEGFYKVFKKQGECLSFETVELLKMAYNVFIGLKITFANYLMDTADRIRGCNVNHVSLILRHATKRIISPAYLRGGLPDAGPCHPRDALALAYLANKLNMFHDLPLMLMQMRDTQAQRMATCLVVEATKRNLPMMILGKAYKPETNLTDGSAALLIAHMLTTDGYKFRHWDPHVDGNEGMLESEQDPVVVLIATPHQEFAWVGYPKGSVIIDPFRYLPDMSEKGVEIIKVGQRNCQ